MRGGEGGFVCLLFFGVNISQVCMGHTCTKNFIVCLKLGFD